MKKKPLLILGSLLLIAFLILIFMIQWADLPNSKKNGFKRNFINVHYSIANKGKIGNANYLCGSTDYHLFFPGDDLQSIIMTDYFLKTKKIIKIPLTVDSKSVIGVRIIVDSPNVLIYANNLSKIILYRIGEKGVRISNLQTPLFTKLIKMDSARIAIRGFDNTQQKQTFQIIDIKTGETIKEADIINNQTDAGFSSDGILQFDKTSNKLFYVQFYGNEYYCLDTTLSITYTGKTIDTVKLSNTNMETRSFTQNGKGSLMASSPLTKVNQDFNIVNGNLYVHSTLKADNEINREFRSNTTIDLYSIERNEYIGSFYIPNVGHEKAAKLYFLKNKVVAFHDNNSIVSYESK